MEFLLRILPRLLVAALTFTIGASIDRILLVRSDVSGTTSPSVEASLQLPSRQESNELLLSDTQNACTPIPSPDGSMIAYVLTGRWDRGSGGLGRSNLRSQVMVMDRDGR